MRRYGFHWTATVFAVALIGGCASSPQANFYTLSAEQPAQSTGPGSSPLAIAIGPVTVPDIVDRPQLVLRVNANQVRIDEFARWAEPLKSQIPRVIAADLAQLFAGALVSSFPQKLDQAASYQVLVNVQAFDSSENDATTIVVLWSVHPPGQGNAVSGKSIVHEPAGAPGYDALVSAHSRALAAVSRDIAVAIRSTFERSSPDAHLERSQ